MTAGQWIELRPRLAPGRNRPAQITPLSVQDRDRCLDQSLVKASVGIYAPQPQLLPRFVTCEELAAIE
jgi:hypothetical protein